METHLHLSSKMDALARLISELHEFCQGNGLDTEFSLEIQLVLEELVVNIIHHGTAENEEVPIDISLAVTDHVLHIKVEDGGRPFDPLTHQVQALDIPFEEREIGGLGILLVRELMDSVSYCYSHGKNIVTLTKKIH
ncbi:MAG: ATP-binding protein [Proteobacteria bacterium]|nr:ATP-binding protein [Pseudomonadota bacterium]MBU1417703.1 ATP-binding protein [Pseudomonadota bacterium]MBU1454957.1 ATP-binding protein [Pseudomonadota bacterium]